MQRVPKLLSPSELASAHSAAHSLLGCDSYNNSARACNASVVSVVDFQAALLRAALALGLLSIHDLHELLPAEVRVRVGVRVRVTVTVY